MLIEAIGSNPTYNITFEEAPASSSSSTGAIVGGVIGAIVGAAIIVAVCIFCIRWQANNARLKREREETKRLEQR